MTLERSAYWKTGRAVFLTTVGVAALTGVNATPVAAQDDGASSGTDTIIVTARKRAESIQDAPIAVSAFDSVEIQNAGFESVLDIAQATPGLNIEAFNSQPGRIDTQPRFRGVVFDAAGEPLSRTGLTLIDGIVVTGGIQGIGVAELERVEVVKGPQSALFGRNSFSGAINYITKDPSDEFGVDATWLAATRDEYRVAASVEGPLIGDILTARINGSYSMNGGHYENTIVPNQELGEEETWALSGVLLFKPTDNFEFKVRSRYYRDNDGPAAFQAVAGILTHNFGGFPITNGVGDTSMPFPGLPPTDISGIPASGDLGSLFTETQFQGTVRAPDPSTIALNSGSDVFGNFVNAIGQSDFLDEIGISLDELGGFGLRREAFRIGASMGYEISDDLRLDVLFGYNDEAVLTLFDFDGTGDASFLSASATSLEDWSIEARLSGSLFGDRLDWSAGFNYFEADIDSDGGFGLGSGTTTFGAILDSPSFNGAQTIAGFGTLDYSLTDQITLSFEGRYQSDEISEPGVNTGLATPISPGTFTKFLPRVVISYEPTDDTLLYFNYGVGNLPGGFNDTIAELDAVELAEVLAQAPTAGVTFDEERLVNYEIGWKQSAFDNQVVFNLAGFYMKRSDEIFPNVLTIGDNSTPDPTDFQTVTFTNNGASTRIFGVEMDGAWNPTDSISLQGTFAYINSEIESFPLGSDSGDFSDIFGINVDVAGQEAPRFPRVTGSVGGTYTQPLNTAIFNSWYARADAFYTSSYFDNNANLTELGNRVDVNLRTGLQADNWRVELFVTNLLDEDTPTTINNIADTSFATPLFDFGREGAQIGLHPRRQFGGRVTLNF